MHDAEGRRTGAAADAVDGVVPRWVAEPASQEGVARTLAQAGADGHAVLVQGGGTKLGWGPRLESVDVLLKTGRLNEVVAHRHGDLTATTQSGITLAETNERLSAHRQWLALDPPDRARATVGGILATNDAGPRRHRHGAPRDLIIGMTLVRADGVTAQRGGLVGKNVAGYDVARLLTGSFGSLGVIVDATFKLAPLAEASSTVVVELPDAKVAVGYAVDLLSRGLTPAALEIATDPLRVVLKFESLESVTEAQAEEAVTLAETHGGLGQLLEVAAQNEFWTAHERRVFAEDGTLLKAVVLPANLPSSLSWLDEATASRGLSYVLAGQAALSVLHLRLTGPVEKQAALVSEWRERLTLGRGSVVVRRATAELKALTDVWGSVGDTFEVMREVKRRFDPRATLTPGRGPGGL